MKLQDIKNWEKQHKDNIKTENSRTFKTFIYPLYNNYYRITTFTRWCPGCNWEKETCSFDPTLIKGIKPKYKN